jgi:high-affinity iron transporter
MIQMLVSLMLLLFTCPSMSSVPTSEVPKHSLLHIIEYIGTDYPGAVSEGNIIDPLEYEEISNFARTAPELLATLAKEVPSSQAPLLQTVQVGLHQLEIDIEQKKPAAIIQALTHKMRDAVVILLQVEVTPRQTPSLELALALYASTCASCHGQDGAAKTPLAATMQPPPFAFTDTAKMAMRSPSSFYHALVTGVPGTGMPAFAHLTEHELWSLSFFLFGFQFPEKLQAKETAASAPSLSELARITDQECLDRMKGIEKKEKREQLQILRTVVPYQGKKETAIEAALTLTLDKISQAIDLFNNQNYTEADHKLLEGYLDGFEKLEGPLSHSVSVPVLRKIESEFLRTRTYAKTGNATEFHSAAEGLTHYIQHARTAYLQKTAENPVDSAWGDFFASLLIILREGFEAFLLILALLTLLRNVGARHAYRWIHAGWICAVLAGIAAYFVLEEKPSKR